MLPHENLEKERKDLHKNLSVFKITKKQHGSDGGKSISSI